eukprot:3338093-Amphidinium_carterae.1
MSAVVPLPSAALCTFGLTPMPLRANLPMASQMQRVASARPDTCPKLQVVNAHVGMSGRCQVGLVGNSCFGAKVARPSVWSQLVKEWVAGCCACP